MKTTTNFVARWSSQRSLPGRRGLRQRSLQTLRRQCARLWEEPNLSDSCSMQRSHLRRRLRALE
eukprot:2578082-Pyramimonas_sp.AAC.1